MMKTLGQQSPFRNNQARSVQSSKGTKRIHIKSFFTISRLASSYEFHKHPTAVIYNPWEGMFLLSEHASTPPCSTAGNSFPQMWSLAHPDADALKNLGVVQAGCHVCHNSSCGGILPIKQAWKWSVTPVLLFSRCSDQFYVCSVC